MKNVKRIDVFMSLCASALRQLPVKPSSIAEFLNFIETIFAFLQIRSALAYDFISSNEYQQLSLMLMSCEFKS